MFEKRKVSSPKNLHIGVILSGRSFMKIKNKRGPNTTLVVHQSQSLFFFNQRFDYLILLFVYNYKDNL